MKSLLPWVVLILAIIGGYYLFMRYKGGSGGDAAGSSVSA